VPSCEAINRIEDLEWPDKIEFIDRRDDYDDDSPACRVTSQSGLLVVCRGHAPSHYAAALQATQAKRARWPRETDLCRESRVFLRSDSVVLGKKFREAILDQDPVRDTTSGLYLPEVRRLSTPASRSACRSIRAHRDHACSGWPWG